MLRGRREERTGERGPRLAEAQEDLLFVPSQQRNQPSHLPLSVALTLRSQGGLVGGVFCWGSLLALTHNIAALCSCYFRWSPKIKCWEESHWTLCHLTFIYAFWVLLRVEWDPQNIHLLPNLWNL